MIDYLIIGQGISGTVLSSKLIDLGYSILIIDPGLQNATTVSAGNINPVTGRKFTKSWKIDEILKACNEFYPNFEEKIGVDILTRCKIYRPLRSIKDEHQWLSREADPAYKEYLSHKDEIPELGPYIKQPLMFGIINKALKIDAGKLIEGYRSYLNQHKFLCKEQFDFAALEIDDSIMSYKNIKAKNIIFCDGARIIENPYFNSLPVRPTKGEVLHIQTNLPKEYNIRDQTFVTPEQDYFWVGSNYDKSFTTIKPTKEEKKNIVDKLDNSLNQPYKIIAHKTGIRPAVKDRKPLIGRHPEFSNMYLFNGMGTKGISLTPYLSKFMLDLMIEDKEVPEEVNLKRYLL